MQITSLLKKTLLALIIVVLTLITVVILVVRAWVLPDYSKIGNMKDEALLAGRSAESFVAADDPYFIEMDKGVLKAGDAHGEKVLGRWASQLNLPQEQVRESAIKGQNTWLVWTGGNDRFWDELTKKYSFGAFDLLKTLSSHPKQGYSRDTRWSFLGLINEPCFEKASEPDEYGLWLDKRIVDPENGCSKDPFADEDRYPGVEIRARGKNIPVGSYYGKPSGIVGLRLFPNPDFDEKAAKKWKEGQQSGENNDGFYTNPDFYHDRNLVRPYRVGMSCAFCHVGPSPVNPPKDPENPRWSELNSNPGAQYFWVNRIFFWDTSPRDYKDPTIPAKNEYNFIYQLFHTNPPGTLDTSFISTDYINNPRTMNAVYSLGARLAPTLRWGTEQLVGGELDNKQLNDYPQTEALGGFWDESTGKIKTARVLKDGSDSVGVLSALNRVYLNIGLFSEEWLTHFYPLIGTKMITPIKIANAQKNSSYWNATTNQTADMGIFFLVTASPDDLKDAPGGKKYLETEEKTLQLGKIVFADNCAACHSSKIPPAPLESGVDTGDCAEGGNGPNYLMCWDRYWEWVQTDDFKEKMRKIVLSTERDSHCSDDKDAFLCDNFLSSERRVPVDLLQTNACGPIATNGLAGEIWDNFTSSSYKQLPPVGELTIHHPVSGGARAFQPLGSGRGYTRPASLVSLWSTAPFLLNNSVGHIEYYDSSAMNAYSPTKYGEYDHKAPYDGRNDEQSRDSHSYQTYDDESREYKQSYGKPTVSDVGTHNYDVAQHDSYQHGYAKQYHPYNDNYRKAYGDLNPYYPGVANRMAVFYDSINQMLNPELRRVDTFTQDPVPGYMYRTTAVSCLSVASGYLPNAVKRFSGLLHWLAPWAFQANGDLNIGPFPEGMPVNLLVNTQFIPDHDEPMGLEHLLKLARLGGEILSVAKQLGGQCSTEYLSTNEARAHANTVFYGSNLVNTLLDLSKCPDFVVNRGHYFGTHLSQEEKNALITYLKTF